MTHRRSRRLLRISLRTVFVLTAILCIWLGFQVRRVKQQREAIARLEEVDGHAGYGYEIDDMGMPIANPALPGLDWLCQLIGVDYFSVVTSININEDADDLSPLSRLSKLRELDVAFTDVSARDVARLQNALPKCKIWKREGFFESDS